MAAVCPSGAPPCRWWPLLCTCTHSKLHLDHMNNVSSGMQGDRSLSESEKIPRRRDGRGHRLPDEETVHLLEAELQNLLLEVTINLRSNLEVLLEHLKKEDTRDSQNMRAHFHQQLADVSSHTSIYRITTNDLHYLMEIPANRNSTNCAKFWKYSFYFAKATHYNAVKERKKIGKCSDLEQFFSPHIWNIICIL